MNRHEAKECARAMRTIARRVALIRDDVRLTAGPRYEAAVVVDHAMELAEQLELMLEFFA